MKRYRLWLWIEAVVLALVCVGVAPATARAAAPGYPPSPAIRPWVPAGFDSLQAWAVEARLLFREQKKDDIDSINVVPYNRVAAIAARWFRQLGRHHMTEAKLVEAAVDSLGFSTDVVTDPVLSDFALFVVRNPFRATAHPMGFMFWFRGDRIMEQGLELQHGIDPPLRVWWNGDPEAPYEWAFVDRGPPGSDAVFYLFRLTSDGGFWRPGQFPGKGPDIRGGINFVFQDVDGDGLPEMIAWSHAPLDPLFEACNGCPERVIEDIYTERRYEGFSLHDSRMVPTPISMFGLFLHLLQEKNRDAATRLVAAPKLVDLALADGWATRRSPGTWLYETAEDSNWPHWLQLRYRGPRGTEHYVVRFTQKDGRWIIQDWVRAAKANTPPRTK